MFDSKFAAASVGELMAAIEGGMRIIAQALHDRLPRVAALHLNGELSARLISAITWCTHLVDDPRSFGVCSMRGWPSGRRLGRDLAGNRRLGNDQSLAKPPCPQAKFLRGTRGLVSTTADNAAWSDEGSRS